MERSLRNLLLGAAISCAGLLATAALAAAPKAAPAQPAQTSAPYQHLVDAANAAVTVKSKALANARSIKTLGEERMGAGVLIAPEGLVLTIGYLILEADQVEITTARGRTLPATVVAYDHATGFGLLRPIGPLDVKPIKLGSSASVESLDRLMTVGGPSPGTGNTCSTTRSSPRPRVPTTAARRSSTRKASWWASGRSS
jgi:S1-C subfamily serine protease